MQDIYQVLQELNISYEKHEHPAVYTTEQADRYYDGIDAGMSKNLFLRNRKGDKHYLVVVESSKKVDLERLGSLLNESKLSFASAERLLKYLGLTAGAVSPFGLINDANKEVFVIVDNDLLKYQKLSYHPNINTATLVISIEDFKKFLDWAKNSVQFLVL